MVRYILEGIFDHQTMDTLARAAHASEMIVATWSTSVVKIAVLITHPDVLGTVKTSGLMRLLCRKSRMTTDMGANV